MQGRDGDGCEAAGAEFVCSVSCIHHVLLSSQLFPLAAQAQGGVVAPPSLIFQLPSCLCLCPLARQSFLRASHKGLQLH